MKFDENKPYQEFYPLFEGAKYEQDGVKFGPDKKPLDSPAPRKTRGRQAKSEDSSVHEVEIKASANVKADTGNDDQLAAQLGNAE